MSIDLTKNQVSFLVDKNHFVFGWGGGVGHVKITTLLHTGIGQNDYSITWGGACSNDYNIT